MTEAYRRDRILPPEESAAVDGDLRIYGAGPEVSRLEEALSALFAAASTAEKRRSYLCLQAWLPPEAATDAALERLRLAVRDRTGLAVTLGYGPRFLHSTGQLHKGDAGNGLFLQLTCDDSEDGRHTGPRRQPGIFHVVRGAQGGAGPRGPPGSHRCRTTGAATAPRLRRSRSPRQNRPGGGRNRLTVFSGRFSAFARYGLPTGRTRLSGQVARAVTEAG